MRPFLIVLSSTALLLSCGKTASPPPQNAPETSEAGDSNPADKRPASPAPPCADAPPAQAVHLGDGITSYNFYFIAEELKRRPGSAEQAREMERRQLEAQQSSGSTALKPPSANLVESEFSHLLGAVVNSNGGIGAAVFDTHGLKVGAAGLQLESIVLDQQRLRSVAQIGASDDADRQRYTCQQLGALAKVCDPMLIQGISCWDLEEATKDCKSPLVAHYRPVFDAKDKGIGVSMFITKELPPCSGSLAP